MAKGKYEDWLTTEGLIKIEGWARDGLTDEQIASNMGICRDTLIQWKKKYSDISDTLKRGKDVIDRQVENALLKRALGYSYDEVTRERVEDTTQKSRHGGQGGISECEWDICKAYFGNKCAYCGTNDKMTKDHIVPFTQHGELKISNIVPACQKCNSSKKDNDMVEWFKNQPFFSKDRLSRICEYEQVINDIVEPLSDTKYKTVVTKVVTKAVIPDTTAQIFWLKNRKPNEWGDRKDKDDELVTESDGFMDALKGTAEEDWSGEDED